jgi:hypothetical protein
MLVGDTEVPEAVTKPSYVTEWQSNTTATSSSDAGSKGIAFVRLAYQPPASSTFKTNQPPAISQQYFSLTTNQHQPSSTNQTKAGECDRSVTTIGSFFVSTSAKRQIVSWKFNLEKFDSDVCTQIANALIKTVNCNCHGHRLKRKFFKLCIPAVAHNTHTLTSINICMQTLPLLAPLVD